MGEELRLILEGQEVPVSVRRNARARRMILRVCSRTGAVRLTLPSHVRLSAAERFIDKHTDWLVAERGKLGDFTEPEHGAVIPFCGVPHELCFTGAGPRKVIVEDGRILVGGPIDMAAGRLAKWLRAEAKSRIEARVAVHAGTLGVAYGRVSIGDMRSRWGSCSSQGTLRFTWRLVMAPDHVLDYVAAHEVAHLLEMNHSDRFWAHVGRCVPAYKTERRWLRSTHGLELMAINLG